MRRLLTIGHSYVVAQNRRLAHEMALAGAGEWQVTAVAPRHFRGDLRAIDLEPLPREACDVRALDVWLASSPHGFLYRGLGSVMKEGWDLVHCWEEPYVAAGAQVASLAPGDVRLVPATFQNLRKRYPPPLSLFERFVMSRAAGWIAFGEQVHVAHRDRPRYRERPSRVIPPGVDLESFRCDPAVRAAMRARLGFDDAAQVVGFVGRFVREKGVGILLHALPHVRANWRALFVGGGPLESDLERFAHHHPGRVHVLTSVPHDAVPDHLNAMDLLCAPSQTTARWQEQFGRMLIEGMACGVPIIATSSGEIPHVVGDAGILIAPDADACHLARAIDGLLAEPQLRAQLSARGQASVRNRYAWPVVARAHLSFFHELFAQ